MNPYANPLFFLPNRVWRCYRGGRLLDRLMGRTEEEDSLFPENWIGSATPADNGPNRVSETEGLSRLESGEIFADALARDGDAILGPGERFDVLCKYLDSAIRLPIQCHPDRAFARAHCHSEFGKTESWFVLTTREIDGEEPYLLMGFRPGIDRAAFRRAVIAQDIPAAVAMMNRLPVCPGDAYLIPGRLPHAIGPGVLMLEVQEPTDLVVQPEERIGDVRLTRRDMWQSLSVDEGLDCFEYRGRSPEEVRAELGLRPRPADGPFATLVGKDETDCFSVYRLTLGPGETFKLRMTSPWLLATAVGGDGTVAGESPRPVRHGDGFLIPHSVREPVFTAGTKGLVVYFAGRGEIRKTLNRRITQK